MKHLLLKIIKFFKGNSIIKYLLYITLYVIGFTLAIIYLAAEVKNNLIGTVIGLIFSGFLVYFMKICFRYLEDISKVTDDTKKLKSIYPDKSYCKKVCLNGSSTEVMYHDVIDGDGYEIFVKDNPNKSYDLPWFAEKNYLDLITAHVSSFIKNVDTVRLDDVILEGNKCTLTLSRSNYFNHLVTNRAVDFAMGRTSIRSILEYGPEVTPLKDSKLSNHLGINALVFLSDGNLLVPRRRNDATISKNQITSSIATRLCFPKKDEDGKEIEMINPSKMEIYKKFIERDNIIDSLTDRLKIPETIVKTLDVDVRVIGLGQNVYEGGKPQMYFTVKIKNLDSKGYFKLREKHMQTGKIDIDRCIYAVDFNSMKFISKDRVSFNSINPKTLKTKKIKSSYEKSFACNVWHYQNLIGQKQKPTNRAKAV